MVEQQRGKALLDMAMETLKTNVVDQLTSDAKYQALMVASAMAITARQIDAGDIENQERYDLMQLLKSGGDKDLKTLNRQLATKIRAGDFIEGFDEAQEVQDHLLKVAEIKLQISNPGYLKTP